MNVQAFSTAATRIETWDRVNLLLVLHESRKEKLPCQRDEVLLSEMMMVESSAMNMLRKLESKQVRE